MNLEIERKFILKSIPDIDPIDIIKIEQWYHKRSGIWERARKCTSNINGLYYIHTIKKNVSVGVNMEYEKSLTKEEFDNFIDSCKRGESKYLSKERWIYPHDDKLIWEVDVFNEFRLIIAEIEIPQKTFKVKIPKFIKDKLLLEVTGLRKFSNKSLSNDITL